MRLFRKIKIGSVTKRWILNVLVVVIAAVLVAEAGVFAFVHNLYLNGVRKAAEDTVKAFEPLAIVPQQEFLSRARTMMKNFQYRDRLEVQIIDRYGHLVLSSAGLAPSETTMPDYEKAIKSRDGSATWEGRSAVGETVMAGTVLLTDFGNGSNGAVRYVFSKRAVTRQIFFICGIAVIIGLVAVALTVWSGIYFVTSTVRPLRRIGEATRRIAGGNLDEKLEISGSSEITELCESVNYMASELKNAEQLKNEFITTVSHELRTPLTAIRGWGETVSLSVGVDDDTVRRGVDIILGETDRLSGLVEELLDFSKMQSGRLKMVFAPTEVIETLGEAVDMYRETARSKNIDLMFLPSAERADVIADRNRLKQVFVNIIDNAIKYTNSGGTVTVEAADEEDCVRITVSDTGAGIAAKDLDHVKEKFYKANQSVRGSGIGLAMADEIIKQHKGLLLIESEEGVGTVVTVVLALAKQENKNQ